MSFVSQDPNQDTILHAENFLKCNFDCFPNTLCEGLNEGSGYHPEAGKSTL